MKFDLHVHTNHSDGIFSPEEVIDLALKSNLRGIAITDHDTVTGIEQALRYSQQYDDFNVIPGIEFSCVHKDEEVHILGFFIDFKNSNLIKFTSLLKKERVERGIKMIEKLNRLNMNISLEDVQKLSGEDYIGRPHIARVLVNKRYAENIKEAFEKFLERGKPAYVERYKSSIKEVISMIESLGGYSVLAHPGILKDKDIIEYCISMNISGLECIHPKHSKEDMTFLKEIASQNNLIITGGSDFHGDLMSLGEYYTDINDISEFKERI